ncbi:ribosome maturation factor [Croceicoccus sp. F390]|uniref:Ribosome maturation factor RimP n=1 Tax=Croceicoccus esteveae TaxID=3075597 RepID=A0ABU2ZHJ0_9SPHN|nr:ribosome maturation factor [Croceicoccus sp. F390]MDT0576072.1 ribosome maturation factor [Croceicoccus sp. F390]
MDRITAMIQEEARGCGYDLVRVKLFGSDDERTLQVMAEDPATGQLVIEQCMALSRRISAALDAAEEADDDLIHGAYRLEVSSPGIDRPLTRERDYTDWAGHEARVTLDKSAEAPSGNRRTFHGDIFGIADGLVQLDDRKQGRVAIPFGDIHAAKLVLTDRLIAATGPVDASGADEIEDDLEEQED